MGFKRSLSIVGLRRTNRLEQANDEEKQAEFIHFWF